MASAVGLGALAADIAAILEEKDPLGDENDADIGTRIDLLREQRAFKELRDKRFSRIARIAAEYRRMMRCDEDNSTATADNIGALIAYAYPERIAMRQSDGVYRLPSGENVRLNESDNLSVCEFLAVASLGRRIFLASPVIKLRADRLAKGQAMLRDGSSADTLKTASLSPEGAFDHITVFCETQLEKIFSHIQKVAPQLIVIDSIQTIATEEVDSSPGSVSQVRECAASLLRFAKTSGIPVILIGHINKEGTLAGPKILEHIVDTVIQFEGDQHYMYRILRSIKNRFGSTSELGIYEMMQGGLRQVSNPSELLLTEDHDGLSGVAISAAIEGVRPFLVETQALVSTAAYGTPQRSATGFDQRRLNMLLAVLEKRVGFKLMQKDVFLNIAGGLSKIFSQRTWRNRSNYCLRSVIV